MSEYVVTAHVRNAGERDAIDIAQSIAEGFGDSLGADLSIVVLDERGYSVPWETQERARP